MELPKPDSELHHLNQKKKTHMRVTYQCSNNITFMTIRLKMMELDMVPSWDLAEGSMDLRDLRTLDRRIRFCLNISSVVWCCLAVVLMVTVEREPLGGGHREMGRVGRSGFVGGEVGKTGQG